MTVHSSGWIVGLDTTEAENISLCGSKAAKLARLMRMGIAVPPGFVVTAKLFDDFICEDSLRDYIYRQVSDADLDARGHCREVRESIHDRLEQVDFSAEILRCLHDAFVALKESCGGVAVRSSAIDEDLAGASFAGQYESFLNIRNEYQFLEAIKNCYLSVWSEHVLRYRMWMGIPPQNARMAVIVQAMVNAQFAGVLFTDDPTSNIEGNMLLEYIEGFGESLVSGAQTPNQLRFPHQGPIQFTSKDTKQAIPQESVIELKNIGLAVKAAFDGPQDLEWALGSSGLNIVQARPDTKFANSADHIPTELPPGSWNRLFVGEWFRRPLSPLFADVQLELFNEQMFALLETHFGAAIQNPKWALTNGFVYFRSDISKGLLGLIALLFRAPIVLLRNIHSIDRIWRDDIVPKHLQVIQDLEGVNEVDELSDRDLCTAIENIAKANAEYYAWNILSGAYCKLSELLLKISWVVSRPWRNRLDYAEILTGAENSTHSANAAFYELALIASQSKPIRAALSHKTSSKILDSLIQVGDKGEFRSKLTSWLNSYGHRADDIDIIFPTLMEDPLPLFESILIQSKQDKSNIERGTRNSASPKIPILAKPFANLARRYHSIRDDRPFYLHKGFPLFRKTIREIGRRLMKTGVIHYTNDVLFLHWEEITHILLKRKPISMAESVTSRRQNWQKSRQYSPPISIRPHFWERWILHRTTSRGEYDLINGTPANPGKAGGAVVVISSMDEFCDMNTGAVVVAPATSPAWSTVLLSAAAIVTERGGALSHAAIIAREYGIPAITGVLDATKTFKTGDLVELDGQTGIIRKVTNTNA